MSREFRLRNFISDLRKGGDINYLPRLVYILAVGSDAEILEFKELISRHWDAISLEVLCLRYQSVRNQIYFEIMCLDEFISNPNIAREMIEYLS